jgi:hypothetical protein
MADLINASVGGSAWLQLAANTVCLYAADGRTTARLELSAGTRATDDADRPAGPGDKSWHYEAGSRVPREPWRAPAEDEFARLAASVCPPDKGRSIYVVRVAQPEYDLRTGLPRRKLVALLQTVADLGEPLMCIGHSSGMAGLMTTTIDWKVEKYIGLHVDNWDPEPLETRDRAKNRICVNVGKAPRYFLYLPISVLDIAALMADTIATSGIAAPDYTGMGRLFMERYPNFPVVRCRLDPNEAYIAPTENLVHDGSSIGQNGTDGIVDQHFTIVGRIGVAGGPA